MLVLVDGHKINSSGTGIANLSTIPIEMIERVDIYKGGQSAEFGPGALGGVINIITHQGDLPGDLKVKSERVWGKWKTEIYNVSIIDAIISDRLAGKFAYDLHQAVGDFEYSYEVHPDPVPISGRRGNNGSSAASYFLSGSCRLRDEIDLHFSGQVYESRYGLPGRAASPSLSATAGDRRRLFGTSLQRRGRGGALTALDLTFSKSIQQYRDTVYGSTYDSHATNDMFTLRLSHQWFPLRGSHVRLAAEWQRDLFYHHDDAIPALTMGRAKRDNTGFSLGGKQHFDLGWPGLFDELTADAAVRLDWSETRKDSISRLDKTGNNGVRHFSHKIGLTLSRGQTNAITIKASYGNSFRLPSLNALFWIGGNRAHGNPGLRPERSEHSEAGLELNRVLGPVQFSAGVSYFHNYVKDLVEWVYRNNAWQPINISKARITGHEEFVELSFFDGLLNLLYQSTNTTALNRSSEDHTLYNRRLLFYPDYVISYRARFDYRFLELAYTVRVVDSAFTKQENTRYYPGYRVDDFTARLTLPVFDLWRLSLDYRLYNTRDKSYVLLTHYPMPGREWHFGVRLEYGFE